MTDLFTGPELKVARAKRHINELMAETSNFLARHPFAVIVEWLHDAEKDQLYHVWKVHVREPTPPNLSSIIGDAIHNLRSALDLLACDVVRHNGGGISGVYFPFAKNVSDLEKQIKDKNMRRASPEAIKLLRSLKPYTGGNEALRAIHDLDVQDKHKTPIAILSAVTTPPFKLFLGKHEASVPAWNSGVKDGHCLITMPPCLNIAVGSEIPSSFRLTFPKASVFPGDEAVPRLHGLVKLTAGIIEAFKTLCFGNQSGRPT